VDKLSQGPVSRRPHGQYCLAGLQVTNIGNQPRTIVEWYEKMHASDGRGYQADFGARFFLGDRTIWGTVDPGEVARGTLAFDVPTDVRPRRLELHDGPISGGVSVPVG
jgi:hypothetical protein